MNSRTIKRAPPRRPVQPQRRKASGPSIADRILAALPVSEATLRRVATWAIFTMMLAALIAVASFLGIPGAVGTAIAEGIGRAGFRVEQIEVTGLSRADRMAVYADALDQKSRAMPLIDLEAVREKLLARQGWIEDAHVSRRLPDTLLIHIVERKPSAIWQDQGKLALIADNGVVLERISADAMPDLPLLVGPGANEQEAAYDKLIDVAPALKPQIKAGTWVGNRRWNLTFVSGETLALPEGEQDAAAALIKFAQLDGTRSLLGKGWLRFDMRDPDKLVARKPGEVANRAIEVPAPVQRQAPADTSKTAIISGQG
ncbi:MAG: cell division protein FtsQ/DivIB [Sphingomonas sp.]